jgi:hypothetical protein
VFGPFLKTVEIPSGEHVRIVSVGFREEQYVVEFVTETGNDVDAAIGLLPLLNEEIPGNVDEVMISANDPWLRFHGWVGITPVASCCGSSGFLLRRQTDGSWNIF